MQTKQSSLVIRGAIVALLTAGIFAGGYSYASRNSTTLPAGTAEKSQSDPAFGTTTPQSSGLMLPDFSGIVAEQGAAVVNIAVSGTTKTRLNNFPGLPQLDPNDPFAEFFKRFQVPLPHGDIPTHGAGSGFIVSADGILLTNAHVVAEADEVTVKLNDKREFKAKVVGADKPSDIAVLRIDAKDLPTVRIGSTTKTRVGEWVLAIGSPFGFENSVTAGIISAKSRALPDEGYVPFLQTDVAINPGNSGGPLFNLNGEVIGINSQIYSRSGGYQGLSFAIPIEVAMRVKQQLLDHGKVSRGRLGVMIQEVNQALADSFGLKQPIGALVSSVEKGSPAEKAGLEVGDVILKFNDKEITHSADLPLLVANVAPGVTATLELWRKGRTVTLPVKVGEMATKMANDRQDTEDKSKLGLAVRPLTADERKEADLIDMGGGLKVEQVNDGPAARAGIQTGDVILSVNAEKVSSPEQLRRLIDKGGKQVALQVLRGERRIFVPVKLE